VTITVNAEYRQIAQRPCDVVDQDVLLSEQHRRPKNGVRQPRVGQMLLHFRLATKIGKLGCAVGIRDADVHETRDAGALGGLEQRSDIGKRLRKGEVRRIIESNPVGVDQDIDAPQ
jgi:hypothetical protein